MNVQELYVEIDRLIQNGFGALDVSVILKNNGSDYVKGNAHGICVNYDEDSAMFIGEWVNAEEYVPSNNDPDNDQA